MTLHCSLSVRFRRLHDPPVTHIFRTQVERGEAPVKFLLVSEEEIRHTRIGNEHHMNSFVIENIQPYAKKTSNDSHLNG